MGRKFRGRDDCWKYLFLIWKLPFNWLEQLTERERGTSFGAQPPLWVLLAHSANASQPYFLLGHSLAMVAYCLISSVWWRQKNQHSLLHFRKGLASLELDLTLWYAYCFSSQYWQIVTCQLAWDNWQKMVFKLWVRVIKAGFEPPSGGLCPLGEFFPNLAGRDLKLISMKEGRGGTLWNVTSQAFLELGVISGTLNMLL